MNPTPELIAHLFAEVVARARAMTPEEKLLEGPRLFERACCVMSDGIRHRHPELDDDGVLATLKRYLARIEEAERVSDELIEAVVDALWALDVRSSIRPTRPCVVASLAMMLHRTRGMRNTRRRWGAVVGVTLITTVVSATGSAMGQERANVNPRAAAVSAFDNRLKEYLDLRDKAEAGLPTLHETSDPAKIYAREVALGEAVRAARADARPGDLFGTDMTPLLVEIIRKDWRTRSPRDRAALQVEMPKPFVPTINMTYPSTHPLVTFPPTLLKQLHQLPDTLEYRFVGRYLILRDMKANLIVDVLRDVLPST